MDIQGLDPNRGKSQQQKIQKQNEDSLRFMTILGQKSSEIQQQRIAPTEDIRKQALSRDKYLIESGDGMDSEEVAEELFAKKQKKLIKKVEDLLKSQQQGLGL